jgi:hypothetical protein
MSWCAPSRSILAAANVQSLPLNIERAASRFAARRLFNAEGCEVLVFDHTPPCGFRLVDGQPNEDVPYEP